VKYDLKADLELTKENILSRVSQEKIFEHYLGVEIQTNKHICSPLRPDKHPTCNFSYYKGRLFFMDWALFDSPKDCFGIVQFMFNLDFVEVLQKIAADFDLSDREDRNDRVEYIEPESSDKKKSSPTVIQVKRQPFTKTDVKYLSSYNITRDTCEYYKVFSLKQVWLNGKSAYLYNKDDPALGYYFGTEDGIQRWKVYFYNRDVFRFLCNTSRIQGWPQLPDENKYCVITKSLKDVMCLYEFNISSIAPQSENVLPESRLINNLQKRFQNVVSLYDFDRTGVSNANRLRHEFDIPALFFGDGRFGTEDYYVKDFSDFVQKYGEEGTRDIINEAKEYAKKKS